MLYGPLTQAIDKLCQNAMQKPGRDRDKIAEYNKHMTGLWGDIAEAQNQLVRDVLQGKISLEDL